MAKVEKKITKGSNLRHRQAMFIGGSQVSVSNPGVGYVMFSPMSGIEVGREDPADSAITMKASREAYSRVLEGGGSVSPILQSGLRGLSRTNFIMVSSFNKDDDTIDNERLEYIHTFPNALYASADIGTEYNIPVRDNEAIIQLLPSGNIDVLIFPSDLYRNIVAFIDALEGMDSMDESTSFTFKGPDGGITARVTFMYGNRITLTLRKQQGNAIF